MQVKKFEARSMKEALELVKTQLGPDAIILSAKDNSKKYGLVGESSFEITAAVSDETLHKKHFVESKLRTQDKNKFNSSSARVQKDIINKFVQKHVSQNQPNKPITSQRYIDIDEEQNLAEERIRNAAQRAFNAFDFQEEVKESKKYWFQRDNTRSKNEATQMSNLTKALEVNTMNNLNHSTGEDIQNLKNEILSLKQMLSQMNQSPENTSHSTYPGSNYGIHFEISQNYQNLLKEGINEEHAVEMILDIQNQLPLLKLKNKSLIEGLLAKKILDSISISDAKDKKFHFFVGPSGNGKTSSLIKMASQLLVREGKRVAILTTDNHKVGAVEQLKIYSQILNVPFAIIREKSDWKEILKFINNIDYILVDFPGLSLRTAQEKTFFERLVVNDIPNKAIHLVLSARSKYDDMLEALHSYSILNVDDVIFNHLDESAQNGPIYSFVKTNLIPIHSFGIGSRIPEDFEYATKERLVDLIFHITKKNNQTHEASL